MRAAVDGVLGAGMGVIAITACVSRAAWPENSDAPERITATSPAAQTQQLALEVAAYRVPCTGEARTRCLRVRVLPDTVWRLFYDPIEGFTFEEGYRWRIDVERRRVPNPPADGSALAYRLKRVVSKQPAQTPPRTSPFSERRVEAGYMSGHEGGRRH